MPTNDRNLEAKVIIDNRQAKRVLKDTEKTVEKASKTAERASKRATKAKTLEEQALQRQMKLQRQATRQIEAAERKAQTFGLRGVARLKAQEKQLLATARAAGKGKVETDRITASFAKMRANTTRSTRSVGLLNRSVLAATAALAGLAVVVKRVVVDSALLAARNETLSVAMESVARNTGTSLRLMKAQEQAIKSLGLTTQASRTILARFAATGLPVERIQELVDTARNLAVVMGTNTSEAAVRLTRAIISQEVEILRTAGLNVKFEDGHKKLAKAIGTTAAALTTAEKNLANFNIVVEQNKNLLGVYNDAMETTGKRIASLPRLFEEASEAIGKVFAPALGLAERRLSSFLKSFTTTVNSTLSTLESIEAIVGRGEFPTDRAIGRETFARTQREVERQTLSGTRVGAGGLPALGTAVNARVTAALERNTAEAKKLREEYEKNRRIVTLARPELSAVGTGGVAPALPSASRVTVGFPQQGGLIGSVAARNVDITGALRAQERVAKEQSRMVADHNQRVFDSLKRSAEGVFDALLRTSTGFFDAMGNIMKTAMLTAVKEIVTSRVALTLAGLFGGGTAGLRGPGRVASLGGGLLGSLGLGGLGAFGQPGAPGGTPGFAGPVVGAPGASLRTGTQAAGAAAGLGGFGGIGGLGSLFRGPGGNVVGLHAGGGLTGALQSTGGALIGGGLLAAGLSRGGLSGIGLSAAGGALIGAKFGGPLGAAIGAAAGGLAGLFRNMFDSARDKAKKKIKAAFGLDVTNKRVLDQIVGMAKQNFGGNLDMAIHSPAGRDLLELFAMSRGKNFGGFNPRVTPVSLRQSGGQLSQVATFRNGAPQAFQSSLPTFAPVASNRNVTVLQLDGKATQQVLAGQAVEVIQDQPRLVQASANRAQQGSFGRRESAVLTLQPNAVLA